MQELIVNSSKHRSLLDNPWPASGLREYFALAAGSRRVND